MEGQKSLSYHGCELNRAVNFYRPWAFHPMSDNGNSIGSNQNQNIRILWPGSHYSIGRVLMINIILKSFGISDIKVIYAENYYFLKQRTTLMWVDLLLQLTWSVAV